jgi:hypothetical protein
VVSVISRRRVQAGGLMMGLSYLPGGEETSCWARILGSFVSVSCGYRPKSLEELQRGDLEFSSDPERLRDLLNT